MRGIKLAFLLIVTFYWCYFKRYYFDVLHFNFIELSEDSIRTRDNRYKLTQYHCHYDLNKYTYTNRVIPIWNSLSDYVVSAETVNTFKRRLDKFWSD